MKKNMKNNHIKNLINFLFQMNIKFTIIDPLRLKESYIINNIFSDTRFINQDESHIKKNADKNVADMFIAIKGDKFDSHTKLNEVSKFCKVLVIENTKFLNEDEKIEDFCMRNNTVIMYTENTRLLMAFIYKYKYKSIDEKLNIFAITGTDGKTSMVTILHLFFSKLFGSSASIGTLGVRVNGKKIEFNQSTPTTPEIYDLYGIFKTLHRKKVKNIFIEATSISSIQKRLASISFNSLSFTNMTSDHLDFHGTLENYYNAKLSFIDQLSRSNKKAKIVLYNLDDKNSKLIYEKLKKYEDIKSISFGFDKESDFMIFDAYYKDRYFYVSIKISDNLIKKLNINSKDSPGFLVKKGKDDRETYIDNVFLIKTNLIGKVNAYNIVHSVAILFAYVVLQQKQSFNKFVSYLKKSDKILSELIIPGRMERIKFHENDIFVDYAHTAFSLENAIKTLYEAGYKKVITIMGCGGNRDKTKRPIMGKCATDFSDFAIITSDNPRDEEPEEIIKEIVNGISKNNFLIEQDRKKAIEKGIELLDSYGPSSALLVAGKGHEDYQEIKGIKYHFSDREIIEQIIKK